MDKQGLVPHYKALNLPLNATINDCRQRFMELNSQARSVSTYDNYLLRYSLYEIIKHLDFEPQQGSIDRRDEYRMPITKNIQIFNELGVDVSGVAQDISEYGIKVIVPKHIKSEKIIIKSDWLKAVASIRHHKELRDKLVLGLKLERSQFKAAAFIDTFV